MSVSYGAAPASCPAPRPARWRWETVPGDAVAEALVPAWETLALASPLPSFAGPGFTLAYRTAFVRRPERLTLHALYRDRELVALLPLVHQRGLVTGWRTLANAHTSCWGFAMRSDTPEVARRVLDHVLGSAERLSLQLLHREGRQWRALTEAAAALGLAVGIRPSREADTWVALPRSLAALDAAMPRGLAHEARGKLERLGRAGALEFERIAGGPSLEPALEACFALETRGWKGFTGVPVKQDPSAHRFYCELARRASSVGQFALYVLRVDGQLIAFRYCLRGGGRLDSLKTSFAPEWARYSPGLLTQVLAARREVEEGTVRSMHFGSPSTHKLRWATGVLPLATLDLYSRRPRGRLASWPPRARRGLVRLPVVHRVVARWHELARRLREVRHGVRVRVGKVLARRHGLRPAR